MIRVYELRSGDIATIYPQGLSILTVETLIELANAGVKIIQFLSSGSVCIEKE